MGAFLFVQVYRGDREEAFVREKPSLCKTTQKTIENGRFWCYNNKKAKWGERI